MSSVQFGWWKQFSCLCSVLFTHVHIHTHTINRLERNVLCWSTPLLWPHGGMYWEQNSEYSSDLWFSVQVPTVWLLWGLWFHSCNQWIVKKNIDDNLPRNCSLGHGSTLGITCVSLNTSYVYVHTVSFVLFWFRFDRGEISVLWHLFVFCSVL